MFDSVWFYIVLCFMSVAAVLLFFTGASRSEREENRQWCKQHPDDCAPSEQASEVAAYMADEPDKPLFPEETEPKKEAPFSPNYERLMTENIRRSYEARRKALVAKALMESGTDDAGAAEQVGYGSVKSMRQAIRKYCEEGKS